MAQFEFRTIPHQHTAVVRVRTTPEGIPQAMGEAIPKAFHAVTRAGSQPAGPPFTKYTSFDESSVEFETGLPVTAPFGGLDDVVAGELGGCEAAVTMHVGPYDTIGQTYGALQGWIESQGRRPSAIMWERYLSDPDAEPDPSKWMTEVVWPVE
jgi:AraC family transcriptional regulator